MRHKQIHILEAPSGLGLKRPERGVDAGVTTLPEYLRRHGLYKLLDAKVVRRILPPDYAGIDSESGILNGPGIAEYSQLIASELRETITGGNFPLVIGGDCSILIGIMLGLKTSGRYGLFFLDGHTDFMPPDFSETKGAAGMDLALVCGLGPELLTNINNQRPYIPEENVWCVGNRDLDARYVAYIKKSRVHYCDLFSLRKGGCACCLDEFMEMISHNSIDGFWIHFDADVLHDDIMPAVDSRQPDGLTYDELRKLLKPLLLHEKVIGMDITIFDPLLDEAGVFVTPFINSIGAIFQGEG